jgi:hypothetical protein
VFLLKRPATAEAFQEEEPSPSECPPNGDITQAGVDGDVSICYCISVLVRQQTDTSPPERPSNMTHFTTDRPGSEMASEARTPIRLPRQVAAGLFQGWGPKF